MKFKAKRIIAALLAVCCLFSVTACTEKTSSDDVPTLIWYIPGMKPADLAAVNDAVNKITVPEIGAKIDIQFIDDGAYQERMAMNMASKNVFDICFTGYLNHYDDAVRKGAFLDITDMLEKAELKKVIPDYGWEAVKIDGRIYAVPNQQTFTQTVGLIFRKDLVDKYNFDVSSVKSMKDLEPYLETIRDNEKDYYPMRKFKHEYLSGDYYESINELGSVVYLKRDGSNKVVARCDIPEVEEFAYLSRDWYKRGFYRPDIATVTSDSNDMYAGKYAVWSMPWKPGVIAEEQSKMPDIELVGANYQTPYMTRFLATATMYAISATSKHPEKAFKFLELLNTNKELYNLICWGIEGKHYEKVEDNRITLIRDGGYMLNTSWKFGNCFNSYLVEDQDEKVWLDTKEENDTAERSPILGLSFDNKKVRTEVANCTAIVNEYLYMNAGYTDPDEYYETFRKRLYEAGIQKIVDEAQRQVDEYLKENK